MSFDPLLIAAARLDPDGEDAAYRRTQAHRIQAVAEAHGLTFAEARRRCDAEDWRQWPELMAEIAELEAELGIEPITEADV